LDKLLQGRRTGLSAIGLSDCLAALNIKYTDGINIAEKIYKTLAITAYKSSIDMAKDRGAFPIWNWNTEIKNPFLQCLTTSKI
jgi:ribonucleoside-diphosphate reductase alpha chain